MAEMSELLVLDYFESSCFWIDMDLHYPHLNILLSVTAEAGSCNVYTLCPFQFQVIAVADPRKFACNKLQQEHKIIDENVFEGLYHSK